MPPPPALLFFQPEGDDRADDWDPKTERLRPSFETSVDEVVERTMYDKDGLPRERIWRNTGDETLVLITCGGDFNPDINRYRQNIVVYAVPVA